MPTPEQNAFLSDFFGVTFQAAAPSGAARPAGLVPPPKPGADEEQDDAAREEILAKVDQALAQAKAAVQAVIEETVAEPLDAKLKFLEACRAKAGSADSSADDMPLDTLLTQATSLAAAAADAKSKAQANAAAAIAREKANIAKTLAQVQSILQELGPPSPGSPDAAKVKEVTDGFANMRQDQADVEKMKDPVGPLQQLDKGCLLLLEKTQRVKMARMAAQPGGVEKLDAMIAKMGDETPDLQSAATCKAAISARFGIDFSAQNLGATKKLPKLYKLLGMVPAAHVKDNPALKKISYQLEAGSGGVFYTEAKKITLYDDDDGDREAEGDYVDDKREAFNPSEMSATVLHEIGHSVDAKESYMKTHQKDDDHGGWIHVTVDKVAAAHLTEDFLGKFTAAKYGAKKADLEAFLLAVLSSGALPAKPKHSGDPMGSLIKAWDDLGKYGRVHACLRSVSAQTPWYKKDGFANSAETDGGIVYQESYPKDWWGYKKSARGAKVSDYQFRSPAEWFAEAYAMYYMKKLSPSHPVSAWLAKQPAPEKH